MGSYNVYCLLRGFAINARIEGMKIRNQENDEAGVPREYTADYFFAEADQLDKFAIDAGNAI